MNLPVTEKSISMSAPGLHLIALAAPGLFPTRPHGLQGIGKAVADGLRVGH